MTQERKFQVGVIGAGTCTPEEAQAAYIVGQEIARRGAVLVCGGLGGVMEAACQGSNLTFKDVVKNSIKQPNQCMTYQNINSLAIDLPTFT